MTDKIAGMKEVVKGKVTKNPDLIQHGQERRTGVLHEKERESDVSYTANAALPILNI